MVFKVGDRVRAAVAGLDVECVQGFIGEVVGVYGPGSCGGTLYGVAWSGFGDGHNCKGMCQYGMGWNIEEQFLIKYRPSFKGNK